MKGWKTESMGQGTKIDSDHSVLCGIDRLVKITNPGYSILDVGCYHGDVYDYVNDIGVDYLGIDLFESHIAEAKRKHKDAKFKVEDLFQLKESADIVFCSRVLMHIPDFELAVSKLIYAAKKYAILVLPIGKPEVMVENGGINPEHNVYFRRFSLEEVEEVLRGCNYEIEKNKPYSTIVVTK